MVTRTVPRASARQGGGKPNGTRVQNFNSSPTALRVLRDALLWSDSRTAREPRSLFTVAFAPAGVLLGLVAAVSLVTLVGADSDLQGAFGAIALAWLAVHQSPISIADITLGALPLVPTGLLMAFVTRLSAQAASTRPTRRELRQVLAAAMGGPLVITMILLATAKDAATVVPLNAPVPAPALAWVTGIHLVASGAGVLWSRRESFAAALPSWGASALGLGVRGAVWLFVASGGLIVLNTIAHWPKLAAGFGAGSGPIGLVGVLVLSILYFPNLMVSGIDVLVGATVRFGATSVGVAEAKIGQLPLLPIFSPLQSWHFGKAAFGVLAVPALIGVWLGLQCAERTKSVVASVRAAAVSAATAATLVGAGSALVCGRVGVIGEWSVSLPLVWIAAFVLLAVPAVVASLVTTAPAALRERPAPVVVISPARDKDVWQDAAEAGEDAGEAGEDAGEAAEAGEGLPAAAEEIGGAEPPAAGETEPEAGGTRPPE